MTCYRCHRPLPGAHYNIQGLPTCGPCLPARLDEVRKRAWARAILKRGGYDDSEVNKILSYSFGR